MKALFLHEEDTFPSAGQEEYLRQGEGLAYLFGEAYRCDLGVRRLSTLIEDRTIGSSLYLDALPLQSFFGYESPIP